MKNIITPSLLIAMSLGAQGAVISGINTNSRTINVETTTGGNLISLADLQAQINLVGDLSKAGVLTAETAAGAITTIGDELTDASATFTFSGPNRYSRDDGAVALAATSGGRFGLVAGSNSWALGSSTLGEGVTHFGTIFYNYQSSGGANLVSVTATFSDASTTVYNATADVLEYTFVGFQAPAGEFITGIDVVEAGGGGWMGYDDVTIVSGLPVPEPSSALLLGFSSLLAFRRRR